MSDPTTRPPPVDLSFLKRTTGDNTQDIQEFIEAYRRTTADELVKLQRAVSSQAVDDVVFLAHNCMGISALLGMTAIVPPLRLLEEMGTQRQLARAEEVLNGIWKEWERITSYLDAYRKEAGDAPSAHR